MGSFRVLSWQLMLYRRIWRLEAMNAVVQPLLYLLGLGIGVGALVDRNTSSTAALGGLPYVAFVAPGLVMTTAMSLAAADSMWPVMGGLTWGRGYHAIAATPLTARDIVGGHALWIWIRCGYSAAAVGVALAVFPDTRSWGLVPMVPVAMLVGTAFAMPIMSFSVVAKMDGVFAAIQRFVIIPLFLFGGAFYPLGRLPRPVQWVAVAAPLWHGVTVARSFFAGTFDLASTAAHLAYLMVWAVVGALLAEHRLTGRLYP
ncbi:MAG: ABC transporter permease [Ilumatobacteraceae bacterium]